ncbi:MAG TPA: hypothetical protein VMU61_02190 [Candidatus Aquilonibacter sp.]|nr:hypothetical protein [Candidatus Aquilonibacter sp.]
MPRASRTWGRKILYPSLAKPASAIVQPDVQAFVGESLLNHDVNRPVVVDVHSRYGKRPFARFEDEIAVVAPGKVKLDDPNAGSRPTSFAKTQHSAIGVVITVEIGGRDGLCERRGKISRACLAWLA